MTKNLLPQFIQEKILEQKSYGSLEAYTMFIDLSGFTPLTESLMQQGSAGAEQLSVILNDIFEPAVGIVYQFGGFIPYFAGDAFNAIFPSESVTAAAFLTAAEAMRELFSQDTTFGSFSIGIKIGLSKGKVEWGIVGNENIKSYYFRGKAIQESAYAQLQAEPQEIIVSQPLLQTIHAEYEVLPNEYYFRLLRAKEIAVATKKDKLTAAGILPEVAQFFLPNSVLNFKQMGEFRSVTTVFISFEKIETHAALDEFATQVLHQIHNFSGYFKEIDFGDKGGVMLAFFGAPVAYENNVLRALSFAKALQEENADGKWQFRMGITTGIAYTGIIGGSERCQYAAVGNQVNLAARLMTEADWGEVLTDEAVQKKGTAFKFGYKGNIPYKGVRENIPTYILLGRTGSSTPIFLGQIIGREQQLEQILSFSKNIFEKKIAGSILLYGEAGIGKSRLAHEYQQQWTEEYLDGQWLICQADQMLRKPFNPFLYCLNNFFEQSAEHSAAQNEQIFEEKYAYLSRSISQKPALFRELERTKSVLAAQIGIFYPNALWEQLDARGRYANTLTALSNFFYAISSVGKPTILQLEDAHWFDESSIELLEELTRELKNYNILILATSRYDDNGEKPKKIQSILHRRTENPFLEIDLNMLSADALLNFAESKLNGKVSQKLLEVLQRSTSGNPFYTEQILAYFMESDLLQKTDNQWFIKSNSIKLTDSMQAVLMARVDRLSSLVKETVKAAAVIGREFDVPILSEVMCAQEEFIRRNGNASAVLREQIDNAEQGQIWQAMNELRYIFRHSLLREAVYEMQLRTRLRELHRLIGEAIEKLYAEKLDERWVDLAFHYEQAGMSAKTNEYLAKAANHARRNYQNRAALEFYNKLLGNLSSEEQSDFFVKILLKKAEILELVGDWKTCEATIQQAIKLSQKIDNPLFLARSDNALGHLLLLRGDYERARPHLENAVAYFEKLDDSQGIASTFGNLGNLYFRQGNYVRAEEYFVKSIDLSKKNQTIHSNTASIASNLGLTYMNLGDYEAGIRCQEDFLAICQQRNDKQGLATLHTNIGIVLFEKGDYPSALNYYQNGLAFSEELGNKLLTSIAIGCIGSVYERTGDYDRAMENYRRDLQIVEELGDKQGIAIALGLIGGLQAVKGEFAEATAFLTKNLSLCEQLGYQKGIAKTLDTLGDIAAFEQQYAPAVEYYKRSVAVSRTIRNKALLCHSLIRSSGVLLKMDDLATATMLQEEGSHLAAELGNPELIFEAKLVQAKVLHRENKTEKAVYLLQNLETESLPLREKAALQYVLSKINLSQKAVHRKLAHEYYGQLFDETPRYLYRVRKAEMQD